MSPTYQVQSINKSILIGSNGNVPSLSCVCVWTQVHQTMRFKVQFYIHDDNAEVCRQTMTTCNEIFQWQWSNEKHADEAKTHKNEDKNEWMC